MNLIPRHRLEQRIAPTQPVVIRQTEPLRQRITLFPRNRTFPDFLIDKSGQIHLGKGFAYRSFHLFGDIFRVLHPNRVQGYGFIRHCIKRWQGLRSVWAFRPAETGVSLFCERGKIRQSHGFAFRSVLRCGRLSCPAVQVVGERVGNVFFAARCTLANQSPVANQRPVNNQGSIDNQRPVNNQGGTFRNRQRLAGIYCQGYPRRNHDPALHGAFPIREFQLIGTPHIV